ncbi:cytochrome C [Sinimarinibacterium sp. CAU 1509]|uniref:cytochrome P460 family protein n=1 Tax=Sinimarinibacterium sp. CAU 1509 TaxID=2562283 RepID=UPI0010ACC2A4|nr:cytochrome P460 family protein [Sinimarinibacterium sp. CAU 1509]TJY59754.1 cytochrome C [Sinimarinibacterium sp. CAU 1509]
MRLLLAAVFLTSAAPTLAGDAAVPYPDNYRNWHHVKSMVIEEGHPLFGAFGGIHHIYANPKALEGYKTGKFGDGSVIVFDLLEANRSDNALNEGARKVAGVMHKDAKKYAATGGWGFEGFGAGARDKRVVGSDAATACFGCHAPQKDSDFVFSSLRD